MMLSRKFMNILFVLAMISFATISSYPSAAAPIVNTDRDTSDFISDTPPSAQQQFSKKDPTEPATYAFYFSTNEGFATIPYALFVILLYSASLFIRNNTALIHNSRAPPHYLRHSFLKK